MFNVVGIHSYIPLSGFANLRSRAQIAQLILSGLPTGQGTLYVDNVYFTTCAPTAGMQRTEEFP